MSANERMITKVKKLLELAKRASNEHEAANALSQAQKLMSKYDISELDIDLASIGMSDSTMNTQNPPRWQVFLINTVCSTFGVESVWKVTSRRTANIEFIGVTPRPELAKYCWEVLLPKLAKARLDYMRTLNKRIKRSTKTSRADTFAEHWVHAISNQVEKLAIDDKTTALITEFKDRSHGELTTTNGRKRKVRNDSGTSQAIWAGRDAGSKESIHNPVNGQEQHKIGAL